MNLLKEMAKNNIYRGVMYFIIWDIIHGGIAIYEKITGKGVREYFLLHLYIRLMGGN